MQDKLIRLCRLYENISKTTGRKYFVRNLSFTAKLLLLENKDVVASVESLEEGKKIRDKAKVFHLYLKYHTTGPDLQDLACEIKARADRRMGNLLSALERRPGTRTDLITSSLNDKRSPAGEGVPAHPGSISGNGEDGEEPFAEGGSDSIEAVRTPLSQILSNLEIGPMEAWRWQQQFP